MTESFEQPDGVDDPLSQARQVFTDLGATLWAAGVGPGAVVRLGIFVTDLAGLVVPGARVEIDALAIGGPGTLTG